MPDSSSIPKTIGFIMDGNRRYARERNLPLLMGHRAGADKLKEVFGWVDDAGISNMIVFAFSTENWNRPKEEIDYLMDLIKNVFSTGELKEIKARQGRVRFVGQLERFDAETQKIVRQVEEETKDGKTTLWLCFSYGGRAEILNAIHRLMERGTKPEEVTEESFSRELWTDGMPDPEIIVRTSGEKRLSGFLPWQGVYSELFFVDSYWPAFSKAEFDGVLDEYAKRQRRFGV